MNTLLITDDNRSGFCTVSTENLCVKPERRKDAEGGWCALFYHNGRSVAMGRVNTKEEMQDVIGDMVSELLNGTNKEFCFPWDEIEQAEYENEYDEAEAEESESDAPEVTETADKPVKNFEIEA